ncbi:MAG: hypothetical protein V1719_01575 [Patescibacteria group bacterium]
MRRTFIFTLLIVFSLIVSSTAVMATDETDNDSEVWISQYRSNGSMMLNLGHCDGTTTFPDIVIFTHESELKTLWVGGLHPLVTSPGFSFLAGGYASITDGSLDSFLLCAFPIVSSGDFTAKLATYQYIGADSNDIVTGSWRGWYQVNPDLRVGMLANGKLTEGFGTIVEDHGPFIEYLTDVGWLRLAYLDSGADYLEVRLTYSF